MLRDAQVQVQKTWVSGPRLSTPYTPGVPVARIWIYLKVTGTNFENVGLGGGRMGDTGGLK